MKAIVYSAYGPPREVLRHEEVEKPAAKAGEVLIRVRAASVNPYDCHFITGTPRVARLAMGLTKPKHRSAGADFSGIVEATGEEVFGVARGAFAEYVCAAPSHFAPKPKSIAFEDAAAIPIAGVTALQAVRDSGRIRAGQRVVINGASGGVGTFAVQIAKHLGAHVTGVCSARNVDLVRSLGADGVVDYTRDDFTRLADPFDVIIDMIGSHPYVDYRRVLKPEGVIVAVGAKEASGFKEWIKGLLRSPFSKQKVRTCMARVRPADLTALADLIATGKIKPVIEATYALSDAARAVQHVEDGHARGKVVIRVA